MRIFQSYCAILAMGIAGFAGPLAAQGAGFDPAAPCGVTLRAAGDSEKLLIGAWVFGYAAGADKDVRPVSRDSIAGLLGNVYSACAEDEGQSLAGLVQSFSDAAAVEPGSQADAEQFLRQFFDPQSDLVALTAGLAPTPGDISAVYRDPLASRLAGMYASMFKPGARIGPKPEQDSLRVIRTTTGALTRREAVLGEFPGGYEKVLPFIKGNYPIVRFKFVRQGEELGLAFDGLIHVNGRWVLMPKPWRAME